MKAIPGFDSKTYPFIFLRDEENIYLMDAKQKNIVYHLIEIEGGDYFYNNKLAVFEDEEGNLKIVTNEDLNHLVVLEMDKGQVQELKKTYK